MSPDGQRTKWRRNIAENFNRMSRVHERYTETDRQTDRRTGDDIANMNVSSRSLKMSAKRSTVQTYMVLPSDEWI